jgi:hypothetical protein
LCCHRNILFLIIKDVSSSSVTQKKTNRSKD